MNESTYAAFSRVVKDQIEIGDAGIIDDLIEIGKGLGLTEEKLKDEFPELYPSDDENEEEKDEEDDEDEKEEELDETKIDD